MAVRDDLVDGNDLGSMVMATADVTVARGCYDRWEMALYERLTNAEGLFRVSFLHCSQ